jgi:hypothetical protein
MQHISDDRINQGTRIPICAIAHVLGEVWTWDSKVVFREKSRRNLHRTNRARAIIMVRVRMIRRTIGRHDRPDQEDHGDGIHR